MAEGLERDERRELAFREYRVSSGVDGNVLEVDGVPNDVNGLNAAKELKMLTC